MNVCILLKGRLEDMPPVMSLALVLKEIGHEVEVITGYSGQEAKLNFAEKGITIINLFEKHSNTGSNILSKIINWRVFSKQIWKHINSKTKETLLWVSTADTAMSMGRRLCTRHYVLNIFELYDKKPFYRYALKKYARHASCVVVPEMCRAAIFRSWYSLKQTPFVMPNKPAYHPRKRHLEINDDQARNVISSMHDDERIVLYQGHVSIYRDIRGVAEAIKNIGDGWRLVVMGSADAGYLRMLLECYPNTLYIPQVIAPTHLQITSHAYIGIIAYSWDRLNNVFCAPNKVYEYAGFGLPMICSDLPALRLSIHEKNAGICVDMANAQQIEMAFKQISNNYNYFSLAAQQLYESVDTRNIVQSIVERACQFDTTI
jgi:glycosyltransferase involved in cell wall biosynthesis